MSLAQIPFWVWLLLAIAALFFARGIAKITEPETPTNQEAKENEPSWPLIFFALVSATIDTLWQERWLVPEFLLVITACIMMASSVGPRSFSIVTGLVVVFCVVGWPLYYIGEKVHDAIRSPPT